MQVAVKAEDGRFLVCPVSLRAPIQAVVFVPDQELSTERARAVLPREVSLKSAVFNLSRAALLVSALAEGRLDLVNEAMRDALHQGPRSELMPWLPRLIEAARSAGAAGAALSGAGTTVFALVPPERSGAVAEAMQRAAGTAQVAGRAHAVEIAREGTRVELA
jgi:homoserine kinase